MEDSTGPPLTKCSTVLLHMQAVAHTKALHCGGPVRSGLSIYCSLRSRMSCSAQNDEHACLLADEDSQLFVYLQVGIWIINYPKKYHEKWASFKNQNQNSLTEYSLMEIQDHANVSQPLVNEPWYARAFSRLFGLITSATVIVKGLSGSTTSTATCPV